MADGFRIYRILCSTPPDLETERQTFESALASFGEHVTFPRQVLFAGASFRDGFDANVHRDSVEDNVRTCHFCVHVFSDTWPGPGYKAFIDLAQTCMADPAQPMRQVAVLFKNFAGADEKVRKLREMLGQGGKCDLQDFQDPAELEGILREIFESWWNEVQATP